MDNFTFLPLLMRFIYMHLFFVIRYLVFSSVLPHAPSVRSVLCLISSFRCSGTSRDVLRVLTQLSSWLAGAEFGFFRARLWPEAGSIRPI
jgi:hypothetical protein